MTIGKIKYTAIKDYKNALIIKRYQMRLEFYEINFMIPISIRNILKLENSWKNYYF